MTVTVAALGAAVAKTLKFLALNYSRIADVVADTQVVFGSGPREEKRAIVQGWIEAELDLDPELMARVWPRVDRAFAWIVARVKGKAGVTPAT